MDKSPKSPTASSSGGARSTGNRSPQQSNKAVINNTNNNNNSVRNEKNPSNANNSSQNNPNQQSSNQDPHSKNGQQENQDSSGTPSNSPSQNGESSTANQNKDDNKDENKGTGALSNVASGMGVVSNLSDGLKNHLDDQRVKTAEERANDATKTSNDSSPTNPLKDQAKDKGKDFIKRKFGESPSSSKGLNKGAKEGAKEGIKAGAEQGMKQGAKEGMKQGAKAGASTATGATGATGGAEGGGIGAGVGLGGIALAGLALKGWSIAFSGIKAILASKGAIMLQQTMGFISKIAGSAVSMVNGTLNSIGSFLGIGATASGIVPTIATGSIAVTAVTVGTVNAGPAVFNSNDENNGASCSRETTSNEESDGSNPVGGVVGGGVFGEGTASREVGQKLFDHLTQKHGYSGAGASGAIGNAVRESTLNPKADNPSGGVHGIFQWSGWAHSLNGDRWSKAPGGKNDTIENELALLSYELNGPYHSTNGAVGNATSVEVAVEQWAIKYEGLKNSMHQAKLQQTTQWAQQAYEAYGGASVQANDSLLNVVAMNPDATGNDAIADTAKDECSPSASGAFEDGTGATTAVRGSRWRWDDLPEDLKQFAHDPRDLGMEFGSTGGWWKPSGQCVGFSSSYFNLIWNVSAQGRGNGNRIAFAYSDLLKGTIDTIPKAGAITSIDAYTNVVLNGKKYIGSGSEYGHTQIVQHVFENGDLLVAEQNYPGYSGDTNSTKYTWHFQLMPKELYETGKIHFFKPDESKYTLKWS